MDLSPDTLLKDRYRIVRKLGEGGMGAVFLARDVSLEHDVAVKANRDPSPESTNQFLREARLLAALHHPNLPRVTDYFILGQEQYLVMDYIPGDDLKALLLKEGRQPLEKVLAWARQLGSALTYMHNQTPPVIHRDIKPANIRLTASGEVVLVDFGIAKAADSSQATAIGASGYTAGYAPPEQYGSAYSSVRTGPFSDQYSLAATLYTMLTGGRPADAVKRVLNQETLLPVRALAPDIPEGVAQALERALSVMPAGRFDGVDAFISSLLAGVSGPLPKPQVSATDATVRGATPTVRRAAAGSAPAGAAPAAKPFPWFLVAVGGGVLAVMATLLVVAALLLPKLLKGSAAEMPTATVALTQQRNPPIPPRRRRWRRPRIRSTPEPSATLEPSATPAPTETAVPADTHVCAPGRQWGGGFLQRPGGRADAAIVVDEDHAFRSGAGAILRSATDDRWAGRQDPGGLVAGWHAVAVRGAGRGGQRVGHLEDARRRQRRAGEPDPTQRR